MVDSIIQGITDMMSGSVPKELIVFIISMVPILELRGGLVAASLLDLEMYRGALFCIIGNLLPIPFILLFIMPVMRWMKKKPGFRKIAAWLERKSEEKGDKLGKYEFWGLLIFVGIPLPGTGAWTGALVAAFLGIKYKKAILAIAGGVFMAAFIMCFVAYGIPALVSLF